MGQVVQARSSGKKTNLWACRSIFHERCGGKPFDTSADTRQLEEFCFHDRMGVILKPVKRLVFLARCQVGEVCLQVEATEPAGLGLVSARASVCFDSSHATLSRYLQTDTEIFANWDTTPEFEKVHILPFLDREFF